MVPKIYWLPNISGSRLSVLHILFSLTFQKSRKQGKINGTL